MIGSNSEVLECPEVCVQGPHVSDTRAILDELGHRWCLGPDVVEDEPSGGLTVDLLNTSEVEQVLEIRHVVGIPFIGDVGCGLMIHNPQLSVDPHNQVRYEDEGMTTDRHLQLLLCRYDLPVKVFPPLVGVTIKDLSVPGGSF